MTIKIEVINIDGNCVVDYQWVKTDAEKLDFEEKFRKKYCKNKFLVKSKIILTNLEWIKSLSIPQEIKKRLEQVALIASSTGWLPIQMDHKIRAFKELSETQIIEIWENMKLTNNGIIPPLIGDGID